MATTLSKASINKILTNQAVAKGTTTSTPKKKTAAVTGPHPNEGETFEPDPGFKWDPPIKLPQKPVITPIPKQTPPAKPKPPTPPNPPVETRPPPGMTPVPAPSKPPSKPPSGWPFPPPQTPAQTGGTPTIPEPEAPAPDMTELGNIMALMMPAPSTSVTIEGDDSQPLPWQAERLFKGKDPNVSKRRAGNYLDNMLAGWRG